jgi:hypothetical protein
MMTLKVFFNLKHGRFSIKQTQMFFFTLHKGMATQNEDFRAEQDSFGEILGNQSILKNFILY